jgi:diguanylate cyclase (GGDEF)-like protein/PAS domain S-box-containing protein/putative nucleotidyltransferase with HDIG domain
MDNMTNLLNEKQRLESIIKAIYIGTWEWHVQTGEVKFNDAWADMLGYSLDEIEQNINTWEKLTHPEDYKKAVKALNRVFLKEDSSYEIELRMKHKNGSWIWVLDKGKVISWSDNHKPLLMVGSHIDITKNKEIIEELRLKEKQLLDSQSISKVGTFRLDLKTNELIWTEEVYKMFGLDPKDPPLPYEEQLKAYTKDSWEKLSKAVELASKKGIGYALELEIVKNDGTSGWIWVKGDAEKDRNGEIIAILGAAQDITDRHQTLERLELSENNLKLAQSIAKIGSWELSLNNNYVWGSEEAFSVYEIKRDTEYIKKDKLQSMADQADRKKLDQALEDLIVHNKAFDVTYKLHTENGKEKYIRSKASMFRDADNNPIKIIGIVNDITELKNKELELQYLSQHDYLTDLYNRRYYFDKFKQFNNEAYFPLGIMMLDVNGLKIINDAFGHKLGDEALIKLSDLMRSMFEEKDVISRIGGDEFTVLIPNTTAEKLQSYKEEIVEKVVKLKVKNIELSLSIGYELKNEAIEDIDDIQKQAENRMYRHKTTEGSSVRSKAINAILLTLTDKYEVERKHSTQVSHLCKLIGKELNLEEDDLKELEQAGLFHDIGKISIPDNILNKPGKLTKEEFDVIKTHTQIGYQILRAADEFSDLAIHALHHHERWDGDGYPRGLKGYNIPLYSRIICIADAYEAMTTDRPYRKKMSKAYAVAEIIKCSGSQFDPNIAKIFVEKILKEKFVTNK